MGRYHDAVCVYAWFIDAHLEITKGTSNPSRFAKEVQKGERLFVAGCAAAGLPFSRTKTRELAAINEKAAEQTDALEAQIARAVRANDQHDIFLGRYKNRIDLDAKRVKSIIFEREKRRARRYSTWLLSRDNEVDARFVEAESKIAALARKNTTDLQGHAAQFNKLKDLYETQLQFKAPVALWQARSDSHKAKSNSAFGWFGFLTFLLIVSAAAIPYNFGTYIADSFYHIVCLDEGSGDCIREISAKGPLTVSGLLMIFSLGLWVVRLQYRVFLSERHLSLDASEKKAFAETFLAMKEGAEVDEKNQAIVLASLFRPTQDGIIRDDDSALDLSVAAILAKQFGRI